MYIYSTGGSGGIRPDGTNGTNQADPIRPVTSPGSAATPSTDRSDSVDISDAGRSLAAGAGQAKSAALDPTKAAEIRGRVLSGAYDSLDVVDAVAKRILSSGDL